MVLREKTEQPDLEIREEVLKETLKRLVLTGQVMFLLDGLDRLMAEDRFQFFYDVVVDGDALRDNFILLSMRPVGFGPMATQSIVKRGQGACFRMTFQKLDDKTRAAFLGEMGNQPALELLKLHWPEIFGTPYLLRLLRSIAQADRLDEVQNQTTFFETWLSLVLPEGEEEEDVLERQRIVSGLEEVSRSLAEQEKFQRFEDDDTGYEMELLDPSLVQSDTLLWNLDPILKQTQYRWEYRHPLFQEFFAGRLLAREPEWEPVLVRSGKDARWQEVLRFFVGCFAGSRDAVYDTLIESGAVFLAGQALPEAPAPEESLQTGDRDPL